MKNLLFLSVVTLGITLWSCSSDTDTEATSTTASSEKATSEAETSEYEAEESAAAPVKFVCTCETSLRVKKGEEWSWGSKILPFQFGELTGDTATIKKKEYKEVKMPDGSVGYLNVWCITENATRGVILSKATIYKKPDIMALSNESVDAGTFVAVGEEEISGFKEVTFKVEGKKKSGWIKATASKLSFDDMDLAVAMQLELANQLSGAERDAKLAAILENSDFEGSVLYKDLQTKMNEDAILDEYGEEGSEFIEDAALEIEDAVEDILE